MKGIGLADPDAREIVYGMPYKDWQAQHQKEATPEQKAVLQNLSPAQLHAADFAGEKIEATLTTAPGNGAPIGGLKVVTANGRFAARPSGTESGQTSGTG